MRPSLAVALVVSVGVALTGCSSGSEKPSPSVTKAANESPTLTGSPTLSVREQNIAEAEEAVREFRKALDKTSSGGYKDWRETVLPLVTGQFKSDVERQYAYSAARGESTMGNATIERFSLNLYYTDPDTETVVVKLNTCVNTSALRKFVNGVEETPGANVRMRWMALYQVERAAGSDDWLIAKAESLGQSC